MKNKNGVSIFKRLGAYLIDYFLVILLVTCLGSVSFINKNYSKYEDYYKEYSEYTTKSASFISELDNLYEDKKLSEEEYKTIEKDYSDYKNYIDKYYDDQELSEEEYDNLYSDIMNNYNSKTKYYAYKMEKYNVVPEILTIVITLLYFVLFVYYVDGVSLGKKIMKLKVVNKDGSKVTIKGLILRTIILTEILTSLCNLISVLLLKENAFYNVSLTVTIIRTIIELAIILCISYRKDGRGLHDIIGGTKVISTRGE